jgi:hypothetical protein
VTITNNAQGAERTTTSGADGSFSFFAVPIGTYTINVSAPGFSAVNVSNVQVNSGATTDARPKPLRVLPCFDSDAWTPSIAALRSMVGVHLLSFASGSTLVYRALSDEPDAIVIATEDLGTVAWQNDNDLIDVLSSTPTVF